MTDRKMRQQQQQLINTHMVLCVNRIPPDGRHFEMSLK
jgi:hypothetical protein